MTTPQTDEVAEAFNLDDVLKQCFWAAKEYRDNPADDYIIEKVIGFVDSNNLFSNKYAKFSDKLPSKFIDKEGRNRYDLLLKSYLELEQRLSRSQEGMVVEPCAWSVGMNGKVFYRLEDAEKYILRHFKGQAKAYPLYRSASPTQIKEEKHDE